jgi:hypothetical protein
MDKNLIYRAIGVPDAITIDDNRDRAAIARLAQGAGFDVETLWTGGDALGTRLATLLAYAVTLAESGQLDGLVGGFEAPERTTERLTREMPGFDLSDAEQLGAFLVRAIASFVQAHPFVDATGHYFA